MQKRIILFYEYFYFNFVKNSIASDVEILKEHSIRNMEDIENLDTNSIVERDGEVYIGFAVYTRKMKTKLLEIILSCGVNKKYILDIYKTYMAGYSKIDFSAL